MTREECEKAIAEKVKDIWSIYNEYNPNGYSLELFTNKNGLIIVNNEYWKDDINNPLTKTFEYN
jgi:hypothetical protein